MLQCTWLLGVNAPLEPKRSASYGSLMGQECAGMQIRSKTYLQMISWLRALHDSLSPSKEPSSREVSPLLIFVAVVLAVVLAMLEADLHTAELQSLGLTGIAFPTDPALKGP
jgi:hypothetical protein